MNPHSLLLFSFAPYRQHQSQFFFLLSCSLVWSLVANVVFADSPLVVGEPAPRIAVGPGTAESSIRQIVRTLDGYVYIAAVDDQGGPAWGFQKSTLLRMYKSTTAGIPEAFKEVDRSRHPRAGRNSTMSGGDMRLDRNGRIHVVYYRTKDGATIYQLFDTNTDTWDRNSTVVTTFSGRADTPYYGNRGRVINSLALDRDDTPFIAVGGDDGVKMFRKTASGWVEDVMLSTAQSVHPAMTFDRLRRLHVAWLETAGEYSFILYAMRDAAGVWSPPELVFPGDANTLSNVNLDQSPSIAVDSQNQPVVLYLSGEPGQTDNFIRTRTLSAGLWIADDPAAVFSHAPGLYLRDDTKFVLLGHDGLLHPGYLTHQPLDPDWSTVVNFQKDEPPYAYDGSASARYDPQYEVDCTVIDVVYFDEASDARGGFKPDLYYVAIKLNGAASGQAFCQEIAH
jgi:hypothetical protein